MTSITDKDNESRVSQLPNQQVSSKIKQTKTWQRACVDYFTGNTYIQKDNVRKTRSEMLANIRLVNSDLNIADFRSSFDPLGMSDNLEDSENLPLKSKFYNIINNPLRTLWGEELKRRSDIRAIAVNQNAINEKDKIFQERLFEYLMQEAQKESTNEEELQEKLQELDRFAKYDLQSAHEKMANEIIQALSVNRDLNIKRKFNIGFKYLTTIAESIYRVGSIGNEPWLFNVDSTSFYVYGLGNSMWIQDGYAWYEEEYLHPNRVVEEFNRYLTNSEIQRIMNREFGDINDGHITPLTASTIGDSGTILNQGMNALASKDEFFYLDDDGVANGLYTNLTGEIKVARCQWISLRKLGELTYFDEDGEQQKTFVDEYYQADISKGETIEWFLVNEIWEGVKIGNNIYPYIRPCPVQMRSLINPSMVRSSYVGVVNTLMGGKARCIVDDVRPYQEDFNIWMLKLKQIWTQRVGKIAKVDISRIPSDMNLEEWWKWLSIFGIAFENPFEESNKGQLSGNMNQSNSTIDLSFADEINQAVQMLSWLENMINKIASVPEQRQGQLRGDEGLGVSQEAITRSSTQTEDIYQLHEDVKSHVFTTLIEYTKVLWKDEKIRRQYQLDDLSNYILDVDGAVLSEAEYGIQITNSTRVYEMESMLKQLSHAGMQNGTLTASDVARMQMSSSPSEMLAQLEQSEDKRIKQQQRTQEMQIEAQQQQMQQQMQLEERKHQMLLEKMDREYQYKIQIEQMKRTDKANQDAFNQYYNDENNNGVEDQVELDKQKLVNDNKNAEIKSKEKMFYDELRQTKELELAKLATQKEIASKNAIKKA